MGKKRSEINKTSSVMSIDLLNTLADNFLTEAWKLEPLTEEYHALNESQKKKFDAALDQLFDWLDHMKPEGVSDFSEKLKIVVRTAKDNGEYPDFMGVFNQSRKR